MDDAAPITWLINQINDIVSAGAASTAGAIATTITPLVSVCFGIYILLITINYLRGAESEPVIDFGLRCAAFALVIGLGLNAGNYSDVVIPIVTGVGGDLASAVGGGTPTAGTLDQLALHYLQIIDDGFAAADVGDPITRVGNRLMVLLKAAVVLVGLVPFLVTAAIAIIVANVGALLVAMVGPIFFACLLFPATRQYFSAWVNTAFAYALIPLFVAVIASVSVTLSKEMLTTGGSTLLDASFRSVFLAAIGNLVLLFLLRQVSTLASSLSAGGINAAMPGSIGTLASSARSSIVNSGRDARLIKALGTSAYNGSRRAAASISNKFNSIRKAG